MHFLTSITTPISRMRNLRYAEVKERAQGHREQPGEPGITSLTSSLSLSYDNMLRLTAEMHLEKLFIMVINLAASHMHSLSQDLSVKDDQPSGTFCFQKTDHLKPFRRQVLKPVPQREWLSASRTAAAAPRAELQWAARSSVSSATRPGRQKVLRPPPGALRS